MPNRHARRSAKHRPTSLALDSKKRNSIEAELLELIRKRHPAIDRGLQFEGVTLDNPDEKNLPLILVLQSILQKHRDLSLVQWPGGIALVRTGQVDRLNPEYQQVNEAANFIIRGGSDKAADLSEVVATPTGSYTEDKS